MGAQCNSLVIVGIPNEVERSMRGVHPQLLKVVPHSWCPTVVICIFPCKMGAHKPELVEMQQALVTSGVSVWYLLAGDLSSKSITLHIMLIFKLN